MDTIILFNKNLFFYFGNYLYVNRTDIGISLSIQQKRSNIANDKRGHSVVGKLRSLRIVFPEKLRRRFIALKVREATPDVPLISDLKNGFWSKTVIPKLHQIVGAKILCENRSAYVIKCVPASKTCNVIERTSTVSK